MALTSGQLSLLVEVGRTGSLARAALNLCVTPPAVSQQFAKLEREVGAALVERSARGARLTALGQRLAAHGARVMTELDAAADTAAEFIGAHLNRLRIGAPPSLAMSFLPAALAAARYRSPNAELSVIEIMSDDGPAFVADGLLDLALSARYTELSGNDSVALYHLVEDPLLLVLPDDHRLAANRDKPASLDDLADAQWASGPPGRPSRRQLEDAAAASGFVPTVPFVTESYDVAQALADSGVAVALVPRLALNQSLTTAVRPVAQPLTRQVVAVVPANLDHLPLAGAFLEDLRQIAVAASDQRT